MAARRFAFLCILLALGHQGARGQDVRVKLCGREFIRMVVSSCGSSRLRRSEPEIQRPRSDPQRETLGWTLNTSQNQELEGDLLPDRDPTIPGSKVPGHGPTPPALYVESSRTRRNSGPAGVCCRSGCTMSELVQYC